MKEFIDIAVSKTGIEGLLEVYVEDAEEPLHHDLGVNRAPVDRVRSPSKCHCLNVNEAGAMVRALSPAAMQV